SCVTEALGPAVPAAEAAAGCERGLGRGFVGRDGPIPLHQAVALAADGVAALAARVEEFFGPLQLAPVDTQQEVADDRAPLADAVLAGARGELVRAGERAGVVRTFRVRDGHGGAR